MNKKKIEVNLMFYKSNSIVKWAAFDERGTPIGGDFPNKKKAIAYVYKRFPNAAITFTTS